MGDYSKDPLLEKGASNVQEAVKEEINLQYHWYLGPFFITYFLSNLVPGILFFTYIMIVFVPNFLEVTSFIALFTELIPFLTMIGFPFVVIGCYLLRLLFIAIIVRFWWRLSEKIVPTKDGIIPRNIPTKILNFYHIRSFLVKHPKYAFTKGPFPWLAKWMYNFVGTNKIGKGTTIEEQVCADKYIEVGKNSYIGINSVLTSHLVEGIFGNTVYFKVTVGDNATLAASNNFASGCKIGDNTYMIPTASGGKHYKVKGDNFYFGGPLRKIFKKKIIEYLKLTPEDLERNKQIEDKYKQEKAQTEGDEPND